MPQPPFAITLRVVRRVMKIGVQGVPLVSPLAKTVIALDNSPVRHRLGGTGDIDRWSRAVAPEVAGRLAVLVQIVDVEPLGAGKASEQKTLVAFLAKRDFSGIAFGYICWHVLRPGRQPVGH